MDDPQAVTRAKAFADRVVKRALAICAPAQVEIGKGKNHLIEHEKGSYRGQGYAPD
jgi:hypothetical protein